MPTHRPYVICHMVTTIDGRVLTKRWPKLPGGKSASSLYESTQASFGVDAWIVGNRTMQEFASSRPIPKAKQRIGYEDHVVKPSAKRLAIGADAKGVLRFKQGEVEGDHVVLLVTRRAGQDYLAHLQAAGVSYLVCGERELDLRIALEKLRRQFGLKKLMLEGGGTFNGAMLAAGLVDEISQLIVPIVDGGVGVTGLFDIPGDPPKKAAASLRLTAHEILPGGVQWLRYRVVSRSRA